jgi:hypothetical protein
MALKELLAKFTIEVDKGQLDKAKKDTDGFGASLGKLGQFLMAGAIAQGVRTFVQGLTGMDASILQTARRIKVTAGELQAWDYAAQRSGVATGTMTSALETMKKNIDAVAISGSYTGGVFGQMGVQVRNAQGQIRPTGDVLRDMVGKIVAIPDPLKRAQKATQVFGEAGQKLLPLFAKGKAGVEDLLKEFKALGGGMSGDSLEAIEAYNQKMLQVETAMTGLKSSIATIILPILTKLTAGMSKIVAAFNNSEDASKRLKTALTVLGVIGLAAGLKMALPYLGMGLVIAAIILIIDDLKTALEGGDSLTGALLDKWFGDGTGKSVFDGIKKDLEDYGRVAAKEQGVTDKLLAVVEEFLSRVGEDIVRFIVEDLPAAQQKAMEDFVTAIVDALTAMYEAAKTWVKAKVEDLKQLGKDIVQGIKDGISEAAADLADSLGLEDVVSKARKTVKAKSPSQLTKDLIGTPMGQGVSVGWLESLKEGEAKIAAVLPPMVSNVSKSVRSAAVSTVQHNQYVIHGTGESAVRRGVSMANDERNRATLAALESTV